MDVNNIDTARSYATEELLERGLTCWFGETVPRHMNVRNREGRWTAVFTVTDVRASGYSIAYPAHCGFKTLG